MASYTIAYEAKKGPNNVISSKTVTAETERTAVQAVKSQVEAQRPGYTFVLKSSKKNG